MSLAVGNRSAERHTAEHAPPPKVPASRYDWPWAAVTIVTDATLRRYDGVRCFAD